MQGRIHLRITTIWLGHRTCRAHLSLLEVYKSGKVQTGETDWHHVPGPERIYQRVRQEHRVHYFHPFLGHFPYKSPIV